MEKTQIKHALYKAYAELQPYSKKFRGDLKRYLFSLEVLSEFVGFGADATRGGMGTKKILDIGTGIALMPLTLQMLGVDARGVDYYVFPENQNEMFALKDTNAVKTVWARHDLTVYNINIFDRNATWPEEKFDAVISEAMIEHLKDPRVFLEHAHALLKPGGIFLLTTPNATTLLKRIRFLFGLSPNWDIRDFYRDGENFTGHWREYTMKELVWMCKAAGFEIVKTYNKNLLQGFKSLHAWHKNLRALLVALAGLVPGAREMNYLVCKKS